MHNISVQTLNAVVNLVKILPQVIFDYGFTSSLCDSDYFIVNKNQYLGFCRGFFVGCSLSKIEVQYAEELFQSLTLSYEVKTEFFEKQQDYYLYFLKTEILKHLNIITKS